MYILNWQEKVSYDIDSVFMSYVLQFRHMPLRPRADYPLSTTQPELSIVRNDCETAFFLIESSFLSDGLCPLQLETVIQSEYWTQRKANGTY